MSFVAPNWRIESEYPSHKDQANLSFWAWQFLRRNKQYQSDWGIYADGLCAMAKRLPEIQPFVRTVCDEAFRATDEARNIGNETWNSMAAVADNQLEYIHAEPPPLPIETMVSEYIARNISSKNQISLENKAKMMGRKWGMGRLTNPARQTIDLGGSFLINGARACYLGGKNTYAGDNNYLVPVFDMRYPVDVLRSQFEMVLKRREMAIQGGKVVAYKGRPHRVLHLYSGYLRVLDAVDSGVKVPEIANILLSHQGTEDAKKVIRNWIKAAEKIRGGDYKLLPAYSEIRKRK